MILNTFRQVYFFAIARNNVPRFHISYNKHLAECNRRQERKNKEGIYFISGKRVVKDHGTILPGNKLRSSRALNKCKTGTLKNLKGNFDSKVTL